MRSRSLLRTSSAFVVLVSLSGCKACTAQHNPWPDREAQWSEQKQANSPAPKLAEDGKLPPKAAPAGAVAEAGGNPGDAKYATFCVTCHGPNGDAKVAGAAALNPKPRDFTDAKWQASVDDARIAKVIKEGGAAVGLSPTMAPWGAVLSEDDVTALVAKVRSFKK